MEHVWPDWLRKHLGVREAFDHTHLIERHGAVSDSLKWNAKPFTMGANAVCAKCNNGWMSQLEQATKVLLLGMVDGRGRELHRGGQHNLAVWALLKTMIFDQASPQDSRAVFPSFYEYLFKTTELPPGVWIWLSSYIGEMPGFTSFAAMEVTPRGEADPPDRNVFIRTFSLGPVVFQVFGTTNPQLEEMKVGWPSIDSSVRPPIHQIWPFTSSITWKPTPGLDDDGLLWFSNTIVASLVAVSERFDP